MINFSEVKKFFEGSENPQQETELLVSRIRREGFSPDVPDEISRNLTAWSRLPPGKCSKFYHKAEKAATSI